LPVHQFLRRRRKGNPLLSLFIKGGKYKRKFIKGNWGGLFKGGTLNTPLFRKEGLGEILIPLF